jgi:NAD(P)-dependent dehydrogenase (short-subunit alcohol dehydrogenase family)
MIVIFGDRTDEDDAVGALGAGLRALGETVVLAPHGAPGTLGSLGTAADYVADVVATAEKTSGQLAAAVLVSTGPALSHAGPLAGLVPEQWRQRVEEPLQQTTAFFQGAHRRLRIDGGYLVVVVPSLSLVGAAGFVPWAVVAEGQRSLAKAAARAWGRQGITVNCLSVPAALLGNEAAPDRPGQPEPALRPAPDLQGAVASVLASLVSGRWRAVTGATIAVDGGVWMTP